MLHAQKASREALQGQPHYPAHLPLGCAIQDRRALATDMCQRAIPSLRADGDGRLTACHRRDEIILAGIRFHGQAACQKVGRKTK